MDIPRLQAMSRYWLQHPPMHILLARHVGYTPPAVQPPDEAQPSIEEINQQCMPATPLSAADFDQLLRDKGLAQPAP